jgi:M-phase inducer tyrosine phosphatase
MAGLNPNNFNFKDLSMKKAHGADYFNVKGSSPTASLAADLSQNFHIDQRFVTPFVPFVFGQFHSQ